MNKILSAFLAAILLAGPLVQPAAAQNLKVDFSNYQFNEREYLERSRNQTMVSESTRNHQFENMRPFYEQRAKEVSAQFNVDALMNAREKAIAQNDPAAFYELTMALNAILISYLTNESIVVKTIGVSGLLDQLKNGAITDEDANKAFGIFERQLQSERCQGNSCEYLAAAAIALSFGRYTYHGKATPSVNIQNNYEVRSVSQKEVDNQRRKTLIKNLTKKNWGSRESNAAIAMGALAAMAGFTDNIQEIHEVIKNAFEANKTGDIKKAVVQKTVMETLVHIGPSVKPILKVYAYNYYSIPIYTYANINFAYASLTEEERKQNQKNLQHAYCNFSFYLNSQDDMNLRREIAYAYGSGRRPEYVYAAGTNPCLVVYPDQPNPRLVAKEWTNIVAKEAIFTVAFLGIGKVITSSARIIKHMSTVKKLAAARNMSVSKFFRTGQLKNLPQFGSAAAKGTAAASAAGRNFAEGAQAAAKSNELTLQTVNTASRSTKPAAAAAAANTTSSKVAQSVPRPPAARPSTTADLSSMAPFRHDPLLPKYEKNLTELQRIRPEFLFADEARAKSYFSLSRFQAQYPSGLSLRGEKELTMNLLSAFKHSPHFEINPYILSIKSMPLSKKYDLMSLFAQFPAAKKEVIRTIQNTGRLPSTFYNSALSAQVTAPLQPSYFIKEMGKISKRFATVIDKNYMDNYIEIKNLLSSMKDYNFRYSLGLKLNAQTTKALQKNFKMFNRHVDKYGITSDPQRLRTLWYGNVDGANISLSQFFNQTANTTFSQNVTPYFIVNSKNWTRLEAESFKRLGQIIPAPGVELSWLRNPVRKFRLNKAFGGESPKNYMTLEEYNLFVSNRASSGAFTNAKIVDDAVDLNAKIPKSNTGAPAFCSAELKYGTKGTGEYSRYVDVSRYAFKKADIHVTFPVFYNRKPYMAQTLFKDISFVEDLSVINNITQVKTRRFLLDMPDNARLLVKSEKEILGSQILQSTLATAVKNGGLNARILAHKYYPAKLIDGKWYIDRRAVYLENAISPRAVARFKKADIIRFDMKLFAPGETSPIILTK